jgi:serine/threonine protein kinase
LSKHIILFLAANPLGTTELALCREARAIQEELERSGQRDRFEFVTRWAVQPLDLIRELRKFEPTVVHLSGRGASSGQQPGAGTRRDIAGEFGRPNGMADSDHLGGLFLQGPDGHPQAVTAVALQETFGAAGASVKLVVLNACYSDIHIEALLVHIDCVIGMGGPLRDVAARAFATGFYGGLGERQSVAAAYVQGCAAISLQEPSGCERPRLAVRAGIDASRVVLADTGAVDRRPIRAYPDVEVEQLSKRVDDARVRKDKLRDVGVVDHVDREILELRRQLREGGRLLAGDTLGDGRYLLVRFVGRGGFAVVWEAHDSAAQQRVAIKVLHPNLGGDPLRREHFFRGAQAMMKLVHPAVVRVLEPTGEDGGVYYFVMEFVPGGNLREAVLAQHVNGEEILPLVLQVGDALALAHKRGMVHRDVKPANILLDEHGSARLTDFDLVSAQDTTGGTRASALEVVVYTAPECLEKPQEATARADVYGLGMTAIFCLSGRELSLATFRNPEPTIARLKCASRVRNVLRQAVAWEPDKRFVDASAMVAELRNAWNLAPERKKQPRTVTTGRGRWWMYAGAGVTAATAAAMALVVVPPPPPALALNIHVQHSARDRGYEASPGDVAHIAVSGGQGPRAIWVFHDEVQLVLRCPGDPGCRIADASTEVDLPLTSGGRYTMVALTGAARLPALTGTYDADMAATKGAGIDVLQYHLTVDGELDHYQPRSPHRSVPPPP